MSGASTLPAVDVVILSWGRVDDTCAAVASALAQEGVRPNVIVIDQGTEAAELTRLSQYCAGRDGVTLVRNGRNTGVPGGRNQGSALGSADYICSLDNDAEFATSDELSRGIAMMQRDQNLGVLAFRINLFSTGEDDRSSWAYAQSIAKFAGQRFETDHFVGAGHLIRRAAFDAVGGYDARFVFLHEEFDLSYRIINSGYRIVYEPSLVVRHKVSADRRVTWNGDRYTFHVRNRIYIAAKYNFSPLSSALDVAVVIARGLKAGYVGPVLRGIGRGLAIVPAGLAYRLKPGAALTRRTKRYIRAACGVPDMPFPQRVQRRLRLAFRGSR